MKPKKIRMYELPNGALSFALGRTLEGALHAMRMNAVGVGGGDGFSVALASAYYQGCTDAMQLIEERGVPVWLKSQPTDRSQPGVGERPIEPNDA